MSKYYAWVLTVAALFFYACSDKNNFPYNKVNCGNADRINSLVQNVLNQKDVYYVHDKSVPNYLIAEGVIKPGRTFFGFDSLMIKTQLKDTASQKNGNKIEFVNWEFNEDTTVIQVNVNFYIGSQPATLVVEKNSNEIEIDRGDESLKKVSSFYYVFDPERCKWVLRDSRFSFYNK